MSRCDPVTDVTAPHIPDLIALAETLRGMSGEPDTRPWPGERRSYPLKSNTEGKRMAAPEAITLAATPGPVLTEEPANHDGEPVFVMDWPGAPPVEPEEPTDD